MSQSMPPPAHLGRYRVVRRLGAGGMAEVFLAKSTGAENIEKLLVVKRVLPTFARSAKFVSMFVDEAKLAMRLNHPNIVQVYAFEQVKEEFLLAMEFVDGLDLGRLLAAAKRKERRVPYAVAALVALEVAKGLDYAHNRKDETGAAMDIVHRDVSPQNVLLSYEGAVKIADFGIARARMISEETGVIKGKFSYMSPEQARGQRVDRRSDVYSLGVLFAEILMNRTMYPGMQGMEVLEKVRDASISRPREVDPNIPPELEAIALRCLALDREERYQTCRSFAGAVQRWLHAQEELYDGSHIETFLQEVSPREVTQPEPPAARASVPPVQAPTHVSLAPAHGKETRERRNAVVIAGRLLERGAEAREVRAGEHEAHVIEDIAFKYGALVDWLGAERTSFRIVLGIVRASADDPLHACRVALDIIEALEGLSADALAPVGVAVGVSRGLVSAIRSGQARPRLEPVANVFQIASDLSRAAASNQVFASGEIYRLARRVFAFEDDGGKVLTLSGSESTAALRAYRLRGARTREERANEAAQLSSQVGLVGRASELEVLADAYAEVITHGRSAYVGVVGEIGVGKTVLVAAALRRFHPAPAIVHVDCPFGGGEVPYAALNDLLRDAWKIPEQLPEPEAKDRVRDAVRRVVRGPEKREATIAAFEAIIAPSKSSEAGDRAMGLLQAVRDFLTGLAQRTPTVLWIDSLQFADAATLDLLVRLFLQPIAGSLMVVVCARPDPRVEPALRGVSRIDLEELRDDDRRALIDAHLGGAQVPPEVHTAVIHRAGGNPFFLKELLDALLERGILRLESTPERHVVRKTGSLGALPSTLEDVIAGRIGELSEGDRVVLQWLAVIGSGMTAASLHELTGLDAESSVRTLEERGLVVRRAGSIAFPSVMVRQVAYQVLESDERIRLHKRVAQYLASLAQRPPPARIARHFELAGETVLAARAYREAGFLARSVYSNRDALRFFGRSLALLPETAPDRFELHEAREQILRSTSLRTEQRAELEAMRAIAEKSRDPSLLAVAYNRLARAELDAGRAMGVEAMLRRALDAAISSGLRACEIETLSLLGQLRRDQGDTAGALEAFDRAMARAGSEDETLAIRGLTLVKKGSLYWRTGDLLAAARTAAEALAIFRRTGNKGHQAIALNSLGVALLGDGSFEDAIACIRASVVLDREAGDLMHIGRKVSNIGQVYAELGDQERARDHLDRALVIFEKADDAGGRADTLSALAELDLDHGASLDGALELLDEARRTAERLDDAYDLAHERVVRAQVMLARGALTEAEASSREALRFARTGNVFAFEVQAQVTLAESLARMDRRVEAEKIVTEALADLGTHGNVERAARMLVSAAQALLLCGNVEVASRTLDEARRRVEQHVSRLRDEQLLTLYRRGPVVQRLLTLERQTSSELS